MNNKNTKTILFASLIAGLLAVTVGVNDAHAQVESTILFGPVWDNKISSTDGNWSSLTDFAQAHDQGHVVGYAYNDDVNPYGQSEIEYSKLVTVSEDSENNFLSVNAYGTVSTAYFVNQNANNDAHVMVFPTVHRVGDPIGTLELDECSFPDSTKVTSNTVDDVPLSGSMYCQNLLPGEYYVSAYVHIRATSEDNSATYAEVENISLSGYWYP